MSVQSALHVIQQMHTAVAGLRDDAEAHRTAAAMETDPDRQARGRLVADMRDLCADRIDGGAR